MNPITEIEVGFLVSSKQLQKQTFAMLVGFEAYY